MTEGNKSKFFTFIHGGDIHIAPGKRVIPQEEYSILIDAHEIKQKLEADAILYRKEIAAEMEKERIAARQQGYRDGLETFAKHMETLERNVAQAHEEMKKSIVPMAIKAAQKIVGKESELNSELIVDIVKNTLKAVSMAQFVKIYLNKADIEILDKHKDKLKEGFERLETMSLIVRDSIKIGDCVIETESGIINFEMAYKWDQLLTAMKSLLIPGVKS
jgi:type III secretion protein L